ncbi:MAG TPA: sigma-54-dependent Fis family transcriptional regulator, partial [Nitrospirae bacterium]|nr:sigma-54-dependent Fis family transcriptional regulator [Nitrospirota bacterium]
INCAAFPEGLLESELFGHMRGSFTGAVNNKQGLFEIADRGSIFLDEIAEMPMALQSKLLRVIEDGTFRRVGGVTDIKVDARIISATNKNLRQLTGERLFREDLFYRLNVIPVNLPPLRERKDDIPLLIDHFLHKYGRSSVKIDNSSMHALSNHEWRGNVRELENIIERIVTLADGEVISRDILPPEILHTSEPATVNPELGTGIDLDKVLEELEKAYLLKALDTANGVKNEAAKMLNISFRSFRHRLSKYGIK